MKRPATIFALLLGFALGSSSACVGEDLPDEFDDYEFRGAGGYFCCDAAGNCTYSPRGQCEYGDTLNWCPQKARLPDGTMYCADWG